MAPLMDQMCADWGTAGDAAPPPLTAAPGKQGCTACLLQPSSQQQVGNSPGAPAATPCGPLASILAQAAIREHSSKAGNGARESRPAPRCQRLPFRAAENTGWLVGLTVGRKKQPRSHSKLGAFGRPAEGTGQLWIAKASDNDP